MFFKGHRERSKNGRYKAQILKSISANREGVFVSFKGESRKETFTPQMPEK